MADCPPIIAYEDFRSGWDWEAVREVLAQEQDEARAAGLYMFVSRSTVLGRLGEYKRAAYEEYLASRADYCRELQAGELATLPAGLDPELPF